MSTYDLIRRAVVERLQVTCMFRGLYRELCPHVLGLCKDGKQQVLAFQFAGESSTVLPADGDWRGMPVHEMSDVKLKDGDWHTRISSKRPQTCVKTIDVVVKLPMSYR